MKKTIHVCDWCQQQVGVTTFLFHFSVTKQLQSENLEHKSGDMCETCFNLKDLNKVFFVKQTLKLDDYI